MIDKLPCQPDLERAVRERPEDEALRLVYADWCLEQGCQEAADLLLDPELLSYIGMWAASPIEDRSLLGYLRLFKTLLAMEITIVRWEEQNAQIRNFHLLGTAHPRNPGGILHGTQV